MVAYDYCFKWLSQVILHEPSEWTGAPFRFHRYMSCTNNNTNNTNSMINSMTNNSSSHSMNRMLQRSKHTYSHTFRHQHTNYNHNHTTTKINNTTINIKNTTININNNNKQWQQRRRFINTHANNNTNANTIHTNTNTNTTTTTSFAKRIYNEVKKRPLQYATIPAIAAFVGISTNYMGVQMLFYPIEYIGTSGPYSFRIPDDNGNDNTKDSNDNNDKPTVKYTPYGVIGWQGVVPARTEKMALRLTQIVTKELLALQEVFARLHPKTFANLLTKPVLDAVERDCGYYWARVLQPILPIILTRVVSKLQLDIEHILDLEQVVLNAFVRDKVVLVELFQNVGRVELDFLVKSGFGFGAFLGIGQMAIWAIQPRMWTLPVAGAFVGYITNWIAIKLLFEPADPVDIGPFILQGLFESRQIEVSDEFAHFMESRVLSPSMLLDALTNQNEEEMFLFLRTQLPWPIPEHVLHAAMEALRTIASNPNEYKDIHSYICQSLDIENTLSSRLKKLSPTNFEDLLHPVFQEDEIILIVVGGVLGALAGLIQTRLGWGGHNAKLKAGLMLVSSLAASAAFFVMPNANEILKTVVVNDEVNLNATTSTTASASASASATDNKKPTPTIRRQNSLLRTKPLG